MGLQAPIDVFITMAFDLVFSAGTVGQVWILDGWEKSIWRKESRLQVQLGFYFLPPHFSPEDSRSVTEHHRSGSTFKPTFFYVFYKGLAPGEHGSGVTA